MYMIERSSSFLRTGRRWQRGMTLIEVIVFVIIVSVALAGTLSVLNVTTKHSADPLIRKQQLAIAEALMEEVSLLNFTWCRGTDANVKTATSATEGAGGCTAGGVQGFGYELVGGAPPTNRGTFSNLTNYCMQTINTANGACTAMSGTAFGLGTAGDAASVIRDITVTGAASPAGYWATIALAPEALGGIASVAPGAANTAATLNVVRITVTVGSVRAPAGETIVLEAYRTRWAPNII